MTTQHTHFEIVGTIEKPTAHFGGSPGPWFEVRVGGIPVRFHKNISAPTPGSNVLACGIIMPGLNAGAVELWAVEFANKEGVSHD